MRIKNRDHVRELILENLQASKRSFNQKAIRAAENALARYDKVSEPWDLSVAVSAFDVSDKPLQSATPFLNSLRKMRGKAKHP